jgi:hypothetical protein
MIISRAIIKLYDVSARYSDSFYTKVRGKKQLTDQKFSRGDAQFVVICKW